MTLVVAAHPELYDHHTSPGHPERPARLQAAMAGLRDLDQMGFGSRVPAVALAGVGAGAGVGVGEVGHRVCDRRVHLLRADVLETVL